MSEQKKSDLVPCSKCGAPVLTNLAECMFCGQIDPGKLASSRVGRKYVETKHQLRKRQQRQSEINLPSLELPPSISQYRYLFVGDYAVTHTIVAVFVVLYLFSLLLDFSNIRWFTGVFGIAIPSGNALLALGATGRFAINAGRVWTFLTAIYLHTSLIDVGVGSMILLQIGRTTERFFGNAPFFLIFCASGFIGGVIATIAGIQLLTTSHTALFGLLAAIIAYTRQQYDSVNQQLMQQMALFGVILLLFDLINSLPLLLADIGGGLVGFAVATFLLSNPNFRYDPLIDRIARLLGLVTAIFVVVSLVVSFIA